MKRMESALGQRDGARSAVLVERDPDGSDQRVEHVQRGALEGAQRGVRVFRSLSKFSALVLDASH